MAGFVDIKLGSDAPAPLKGGRGSFRGLDRELTNGEFFRSLMEQPSFAWHAQRHEKAKEFMDRFLRQNIAEVDEIPFHSHKLLHTLSPSELALYLELESHLQATEVRMQRKTKKDAGDRERRILAALGNSASSEEALLKRCCHDMLDSVNGRGHGEDACSRQCRVRKDELKECRLQTCCVLAEARALRKIIHREDAEFDSKHLDFWEKEAKTGESGAGCADPETKKTLGQILCCSESRRPVKRKAADKDSGPKKSAAERLEGLKWELREVVVRQLGPLRKELVARRRSLRFFEAVRAMQSQKGNLGGKCVGCGRKIFPRSMGVLSCCGHTGCVRCLRKYANDHECPVPGCGAFVKHTSVHDMQSLRVHSGTGDSKNKFLSKIERVVEIIRGVKPDERVLVFTQFADLEAKVAKVLEAHDVKAARLQGTAHSKSGAVASFQQDKLESGDARVLLLNVSDESASGINLTTANHAIFVHPLLSQTQEEYVAWRTQAVGRIRRYGQLRKCHIYNIIARDTIDMKIVAQRKLD